MSISVCSSLRSNWPLEEEKLLLSLTPFLTPSSCLLSFLLRSQISMCVAHSISCKQLTQVDPSGMVRSQTHILLDKACPLSCHGLKQTGKHTYRRVHTHTHWMFVMSVCVVLWKSGPMWSVWYTSTVCLCVCVCENHEAERFTAAFCRWRTHGH